MGQARITVARFSDIITLRQKTVTFDDEGNPKPSVEDTDVFYNPYRLNLTTMLQGGADGQKRTLAGQVRACDYSGQNMAVIGGEEYTITGANNTGEYVTLTLESLLQNG